MNSKPTISIIGGSIWGNRGAEAMLVTAIGRIREKYPQAQFHAFTPYPRKDRELVTDELVDFLDSRPKALIFHLPFALLYWLFKKIHIPFPLPKPLKALRESTLLLDIGGITFADGRAIFLIYNVLTIWPAMLLGTPVIKLSQAMGPFQNPLNRTIAKTFITRCLFVFARGKYTASYLKDIFIDSSRWSCAADIAFLYKDTYSLSVENDEKVQNLITLLQHLKTRSCKVISISPSVLVQEKTNKQGGDYSTALLEMLKKVDDPNTHYVFFPNASRENSEKSRNNDIIAIRTIEEKAKKLLAEEMQKRIQWITYDINTSTVRSITELSDVLITSRFHAMISGLSLSVPTMVIGWSHKYLEAMEGFSLEPYVIDYKQTDKDYSYLLRELMGRIDDIRAEMLRSLPSIKESAESQFAYLESLIG